MALQSFTVSIGALRDVNNNDKNYVSGEAIYVKTIGGSFAPIFRDLAGTSEISQDGLANKTNEKGQFTFFVEAGDYVLEYQSQSTPVTIVGADYFNSRIEETVNQIIIDTSTSRGFRVVGDFASGFTYELPNDVAIDGDGNYWAYADVNALPVTVTDGTTPTEGEYSQRTWNSASAVLTDSGGTVQGYIDDNLAIASYEEAEVSTYDFTVGRFIYISDRDFAKFKVVTGKVSNGYDILDTANGKQLELVIEKGEFNVCAFGAKGGGGTDDYLPIQRANVAAVEYANNTGNGATILYPPKDFYVTSTVSPLPEGENTLDRYNAGQAGTLTTKVENITIRGYGARLVCDTATFVPSFPFCMMTAIEADNVKVYGLAFESDLNNKVPNWIDPTNYFNRSAPTVTGEAGFIAIRTTGFKFIDCPVHHCEVGLVITDDRTFTIPTPDPMETYRSEVRGCDFFNCWQLMSMTYGATEELLIYGNSMRYGFIKLVQESDQGRAMLITHNTFRDISGILTNTNDTQIVSNTFNNLLGGFGLQPQGGSNSSTDYNYDLTNLLIKDNTCYSDHATEVDGEAIGAGTDKPSQFLRISATSAATAGQTVNIDNLRIEGNTADLWARGGSSTGAVINRDGDGMINIKSMSVTGKNKFTIKDGATATICLAPNAAFSNTTISGKVDISDNDFLRENASSAFEFQMWFASSTGKALVKFNDNNVDMPQSVNRVVTVGGVRNFKSKGNEYNLDGTSIATSAVYWMAGVKNYDIEKNDILRDPSEGNIGYIVYHDGLTTGVYDTVNDKPKVSVKDNTINVAQFVFASNVAFPVSSKGFFDLFGNTISTNTTTGFQTYPTISGFNASNVVNPHIDDDPLPVGIPLVPPYFVCWNGSFTTGTPTGWRYNGANWRAISSNP